MNGNGSIQINTTSVIFPDDKIQELEIIQRRADNASDNPIYWFVNVTNLNVSNYTSANINATDSQIILSDGRGLYGNISLNSRNLSPYIFSFADAAVQGISNNMPFKVDNVSSMSIKGQQQPYTLYLKQPHVNIKGSILIKNNYFFESYITPSQIPEIDRLINGSLTFSIFMSDYYTLIDDSSTTGSIHKVPPVSHYNEFNFINSLFSSFNLLSIPLPIWSL